MTSRFGLQQDHLYMQEALTQARLALAHDEVPIGAIIVDSTGVIIARSFNQIEEKKTQAAHAEVQAIVAAGAARNDWRMEGCWLYVTLEPCMMCMGAILLSRFEGVVFAASSPQFGYRLDNNIAYQLYKYDTIKIVEGICSQESADLLKTFFKKKRILSE